MLSKNDFYDARVWLNYTNAIVDHKEMVEQKHELIVRRQKLRGRMSCNVETITRLRREILSHRSELGDRIHEVNRILNKIAELDRMIAEKQELFDLQKDLFVDAKQEQLTKLSKLDEFDEDVIRNIIDYVLIYDNEHMISAY